MVLRVSGRWVGWIAGLPALVLLLGSCSGGGGSSGNSGPSLALFAGNLQGRGSADGTGAAARFSFPFGIAADSAGNVYVADTSNHSIRKITPAGAVTTLAGTPGSSGSADGVGAAARFNFPEGIAADSTGNVYVADTSNNTIRKITSDRVVTTLAGTAGPGGSDDGNGAAARFDFPLGVATDSAGNVYVADALNSAVRKIDSLGNVVTLPGTATGACAFPRGIATDGADNVYVGTGIATVCKISPAGVVTTVAGTAGMSGSDDGTGADARFGSLFSIATDGAGNIYAADGANNTIRKITPAGVVTTLAGTAGMTGSADGTGAAARFNRPFGVATDGLGNVYVADVFNNTIRKITSAGSVTTLAGAARVTGSADGTGASATFNLPDGIATDSAGNVYVADSGNNTIRRITPAAAVTTLAGTAGTTGSADDTGAAASFNQPFGIAADGSGNIYVADSDNNTIRKITPAGVVTTLAGMALAPGSDDGTGAAARFNAPVGVATDSAGNIYVADSGNNTIRKVTPEGAVATLAGTAGPPGSADGNGAAARFNFPAGVATDTAGNVYVTDLENNTIRKITPAGEVTTLAGTAGVTGSADGVGAAASFNLPAALAVDSAGNVYVADFGNSTIRKIDPAGAVTTVVGVAGQGGFVPGELPGQLAFPIGVAISGSSLYIVFADGVAVVPSRP